MQIELQPLQNDRFRVGSLVAVLRQCMNGKRPLKYIRSKYIVFNHDLESMIRSSCGDSQRIVVRALSLPILAPLGCLVRLSD